MADEFDQLRWQAFWDLGKILVSGVYEYMTQESNETKPVNYGSMATTEPTFKRWSFTEWLSSFFTSDAPQISYTETEQVAEEVSKQYELVQTKTGEWVKVPGRFSIANRGAGDSRPLFPGTQSINNFFGGLRNQLVRQAAATASEVARVFRKSVSDAMWAVSTLAYGTGNAILTTSEQGTLAVTSGLLFMGEGMVNASSYAGQGLVNAGSYAGQGLVNAGYYTGKGLWYGLPWVGWGLEKTFDVAAYGASTAISAVQLAAYTATLPFRAIGAVYSALPSTANSTALITAPFRQSEEQLNSTIAEYEAAIGDMKQLAVVKPANSTQLMVPPRAPPSRWSWWPPALPSALNGTELMVPPRAPPPINRSNYSTTIATPPAAPPIRPRLGNSSWWDWWSNSSNSTELATPPAAPPPIRPRLGNSSSPAAPPPIRPRLGNSSWWDWWSDDAPSAPPPPKKMKGIVEEKPVKRYYEEYDPQSAIQAGRRRLGIVPSGKDDYRNVDVQGLLRVLF